VTSRASLLAVCTLVLALVGGAWWLLRTEPGATAPAGAALRAPEAAADRPVVLPQAGELARADGGAGDAGRTAPEQLAASGPALAAASGRVVDRSGAPVVGATITPFLSGPGQPYRTREDLSPKATAGADGRFLFPNLPAGAELGIEVEHEGHAPALRESFVVQAGGVEDLGDVVLDAGMLLLGTVAGADGKPLAGAEVRLTDLQRGQRGAVGAAPLIALTDASGGYAFPHLALRQYQVEASGAGCAPVTLVLSLVLGNADGRWRQDFVLERADASMAGLVLDDQDRPVAGLALRISQRQRAQNTYRLQTATTGDDGRFLLPALAAGLYEVEVQSPAVYLDQPLQLPADGAEHVVRVQSALSVAGRLRCAAATPPEDFRVHVRPDARSGAGLLGGAPMERSFRATQPRGAFVVEGLRPGSYRFEVHAEGYAVTASSDVILGGGVPRAEVEIYLLRGGRVSGRLDPPEADARVELRDSDYDPSMSLEATFPTPPVHDLVTRSGADGRFLLERVPPGDYTLSVRPAASPPLHVRDVRVADETETDLGALVLPRSGALAGRVSGPDGRPRAGVRIAATSATHQEQTVTDAQGDFRMAALPPGDYEVVATPSGLWEALQFEGRAHVTLAADQELPVVLTLGERSATPR
jgi:hypothetical protein